MKNKDFLLQLLESDTLQQQVDLVSTYLEAPILVILPSLAISAHSESNVIPDHTWQNAVRRGYITLEFGNSLSNWESLKDDGQDYLTVNTISAYRRRFFRLMHQQQVIGYLNIGEVNRSLDAISKEDIQMISAILSRTLYSQNTHASPNQNRVEDILHELLMHAYVDRLHYLERIHQTSFEAAAPHRLGCIPVKEMSSFNADEDTLRLELNQFFPDCVVTVVDGFLYVFITLPKKILDTKPFEKWLNEKKTMIGFSDIFYDCYPMKHYQAQAIYAYENMKKEPICYYDEVIIYDFFSHIDQSQKEAYCCTQIKMIAQHDQNHDTQYLPTLLAWLMCNGNLQETAKRLGMHRNSVHYRLQRIEEEFSMNLQDERMNPSWLLSCIIQTIRTK